MLFDYVSYIDFSVFVNFSKVGFVYFFFVSLCFLFFFLRNARVGITQAVG